MDIFNGIRSGFKASGLPKIGSFSLVVLMLLFTAGPALAVNGANLFGFGAISRSMGGVGVAAPQDAASIAYNPASQNFAHYSKGTQFDASGSFINPRAEAAITTEVPAGGANADVRRQVFFAPYLGVSSPMLDKDPSDLRFGLNVYAASGIGADYKRDEIDQPAYYGYTVYQNSPVYADGTSKPLPLVGPTFSLIQVMKIQPAVSKKVTDNLSVGVSVHVTEGNFDLGAGTVSQWGLGGQLGLLYKVANNVNLGMSYTSPIRLNLDRITDLDGNGSLDDLKFDLPQTAIIGLSYATSDNRFLVETDVKWVNWANAKGWEDLDWRDQWVFGIGAQYYVIPKLALRAGYNYARTPITEHNGFNGLGIPSNVKNVQGYNVPTYYYEMMRGLSIPPFMEHHITVGLGYQLTPHFSVNLGYVHEFSDKLNITGTGLLGGQTTIEHKTDINSYELGLAWKF
jgi:long-chain fatty acid transport protein